VEDKWMAEANVRLFRDAVADQIRALNLSQPEELRVREFAGAVDGLSMVAARRLAARELGHVLGLLHRVGAQGRDGGLQQPRRDVQPLDGHRRVRAAVWKLRSGV
jgi:hypothetical protein